MLHAPTVATATSARATARRPFWLFEVLLLAAFYVAYAWIRDEHGRDVRGSHQQRVAFAHARDLLSTEGHLHLDPEHFFQTLLPRDGFPVHLVNGFYLLAHVTVTVAVLVFLLWRRPALYRRCRNALLVISTVSLALFALYPTAPPRLLPAAHIHDTLVAGGWWSLNHGGIERIADPYAAMPSLHLGWSTWVALSLAASFAPTWRRWLFALYPLAVTWVVLATGAHWFLDTAAGAALALVGWAAAGRVTRSGRHRFPIPRRGGTS
ncbi:MAG: phosphatase PAP2 family protein [Mycobacteriales bacterium]